MQLWKILIWISFLEIILFITRLGIIISFIQVFRRISYFFVIFGRHIQKNLLLLIATFFELLSMNYLSILLSVNLGTTFHIFLTIETISLLCNQCIIDLFFLHIKWYILILLRLACLIIRLMFIKIDLFTILTFS